MTMASEGREEKSRKGSREGGRARGQGAAFYLVFLCCLFFIFSVFYLRADIAGCRSGSSASKVDNANRVVHVSCCARVGLLIEIRQTGRAGQGMPCVGQGLSSSGVSSSSVSLGRQRTSILICRKRVRNDIALSAAASAAAAKPSRKPFPGIW